MISVDNTVVLQQLLTAPAGLCQNDVLANTVVVARTLSACAVFFLVIAMTTRLLWASFGAAFGPVGGRSKAFQAFFLYLLQRLYGLTCVKEILDF